MSGATRSHTARWSYPEDMNTMNDASEVTDSVGRRSDAALLIAPDTSWPAMFTGSGSESGPVATPLLGTCRKTRTRVSRLAQIGARRHGRTRVFTQSRHLGPCRVTSRGDRLTYYGT